MEKTLNLFLYDNGQYQDYQVSRGIGVICGEFVEHFLNTPRAPLEIAFTYTDKNPKKKGFKKVWIVPNEQTAMFPYKVYVSGKFYKNVALFWKLENDLIYCGKNEFWIKIEKI